MLGIGSAIKIGGLLGNALKGDDDKGPTWKQQRRHHQNMADQDWNRQRYVLKNQIQWRADDAKAAGIHPLAALGASSAMYSPAGAASFQPQQESGDEMLNAAMALAEAFNKPSELDQAQSEYWRAKADEAKATSRTLASELRTGRTQTNFGDPDPKTKVGSIDVSESKNWSDAEVIEQRYGDVASWAYGLGVIVADLGETWRSYSTDQKLKVVRDIRQKAKETSEGRKKIYVAPKPAKIEKLVEIPGDAP